MSLTRLRFIGLALLGTACASSNTNGALSPSERSSSRSKPTAPQEGQGSSGRPKAAVDYNRLPDLPQYPCGPAQFATGTGGKLNPAVIQEHLRASFSKLRRCYEQGVRNNAGLGGKVTVRFVIEKDGRVGNAVPVCTSMPDPAVVACIVAEYGLIRFPRPEAGSVTVVYPVTFSPGN
jgi:outer membrane biosynthesis protein TonB